MGTRQDFHAEHAAHREAYALRYGPPRMVEVETLYILSTYLSLFSRSITTLLQYSKQLVPTVVIDCSFITFIHLFIYSFFV